MYSPLQDETSLSKIQNPSKIILLFPVVVPSLLIASLWEQLIVRLQMGLSVRHRGKNIHHTSPPREDGNTQLTCQSRAANTPCQCLACSSSGQLCLLARASNMTGGEKDIQRQAIERRKADRSKLEAREFMIIFTALLSATDMAVYGLECGAQNSFLF
jgi:hypothetical protein